MEVIWIVLAVAVGSVLYRYFAGHGGMRISRAALTDLPADGALVVGGAELRWSAATDDAFVAAWPLPSGHWVVLRVSFEDAPDPDAGQDTDLGRLDVSVADRLIVSGAAWTDQILDRGLRADVENVLRALAAAAKRARSDAARAALAKPVGTRQELD